MIPAKNERLNVLPERQWGFTLLELMVATVIGLLLIAVTVKVYIDSSSVYRYQQNLSRVQENGRFALEFLQRDIRMAGYWGCYAASTMQNSLATGVTGSIDLRSFRVAGVNPAASAAPWTARVLCDTLVLGGAVSVGMEVTATMAADSSDVTVSVADAAKLYEYATLDDKTDDKRGIVVISDCGKADVFQIRSINTGAGVGVIGHTDDTGENPPGNSTPSFQDSYEAGSRIFVAAKYQYKLDDSFTNSGELALFRLINKPDDSEPVESEELVEGVENMQILYGEDTDGDLVANRYLPASSVGDMTQVVSIRVSLLMRSKDDNLAEESVVPYVYNGVTVTPADKRIRKVFSTTVAVRNRLL